MTRSWISIWFRHGQRKAGHLFYLGLHRIIRQGSSAKDFFQFKVSKTGEYCMYFPFLKLQKWCKRSADAIVRCCHRFILHPLCLIHTKGVRSSFAKLLTGHDGLYLHNYLLAWAYARRRSFFELRGQNAIEIVTNVIFLIILIGLTQQSDKLVLRLSA